MLFLLFFIYYLHDKNIRFVVGFIFWKFAVIPGTSKWGFVSVINDQLLYFFWIDKLQKYMLNVQQV